MKKIGLNIGTAHQIARDATIGLAVFIVFAFGVTLDRTGGVGSFQSLPQFSTTHANAIQDRVERSHSRANVNASLTVPNNPAIDMAFARTDQTTAIVLLACMFSAVFAFNLAFYRHLRTVYAATRRKQLRRT